MFGHYATIIAQYSKDSGESIMKRFLLTGISLFAAGLAASPALAAESIKLTVGGHFKEAYLFVSDDDGKNADGVPDLGKDRAADGFFNDAEIDFTGTTMLDNGLEVGAHIELEGETDGDQIDESYVWFAGGFGEIRIGSDDEALHKACVVPPGGSSNFSAFSPNQWGSNDGLLISEFGGRSDNSICTGVDEKSDAQKIIYTSPAFGGFQLTASYTPNGGTENHTDGGGPHVGMPAHVVGGSRHNTSVALNYGYDGGTWGMEASLGGSWEGHVEQGQPAVDLSFKEQDFYQAGVNFYFGNFAIGVGGEYYNDRSDFRLEAGSDFEDVSNDVWVAGIGASYRHDAWIFGAQYSHMESDLDIEISSSSVPFDELQTSRDRAVATATYLLGPGMNLDAEVGYTWIDTDPEAEVVSSGGDDLDDYQALELGIGATITF